MSPLILHSSTVFFFHPLFKAEFWPIQRLLVEKPLIYTWNQCWHSLCAFAISTKSFLVAWFVAGGSRGLTTSTCNSKIPSPHSLLCRLLPHRDHSGISTATGSLAELKRNVSACTPLSQGTLTRVQLRATDGKQHLVTSNISQ